MTEPLGVLLWHRLRLACRIWRRIMRGDAVMCGMEMAHEGRVLFRPGPEMSGYTFTNNIFISHGTADLLIETSAYGVVPLREMFTD